MKCAAVVVAFAALSSCGKYADFNLPPPDATGPRAPFSWEAMPQPVLGRGPEAWDSVDVLNPSVVRFYDSYWNFYSGFDGSKWSTGAATSTDGVAWKKVGRALAPEGWESPGPAGQGSNGSALVEQGEILYWYVAGNPPGIALARSKDGLNFAKRETPVMRPGPRGSFDEMGAADPYVIRRGDYFYLFYLGQNRARRQTIGLARSRYGIEWEKLRTNPALELGAEGTFDENGLGEPAVWTSGGFYWMLYTGRDKAEHRRVGLARSLDGIHWDKDTSFTPISGNQPWDSQVICDPTVELQGNDIRVWFGGGDVAHPVANIHGQIGFGVLHGRAR